MEVRLDSPRIALIRRLFEYLEQNEVALAAEELIRHSTEDVEFEPYVAHGRAMRGHEQLREFWSNFADEGRQLRAGAYSMTEEGDTVVVTGWVRTIDEGRLADTQSRWVYRFNDDGKVVSARVERA
jgi:SnoaL-like domain